MSTSVENILSDIFGFLKKFIGTFLGVFTNSYKGLVDDKALATSEILNPNLYIILTITIFYSLTIGIINYSAVGSAGLAISYYLGLKNYSLIERFLYSIPIWLCFFLFVRTFALLFKKERRQNFIFYTSYVIGTLLLVFLIIRFLLLLLYLLGWEILPYEPYYYSYESTRQLVNPFIAINKNLDFVVSGFALILCFYKLMLYFKKQQNRNYLHLALIPVSIGLIFFLIIRITRVEIKALERYFPQNRIQIATNLDNNNELKFHFINSILGKDTLSASIYITNSSEENIILERKDRYLLYFSNISASDKTPLVDSLSNLQFGFRNEDKNDSLSLIISSGDTKLLRFEASLDSLQSNWLSSQFRYDKIEHDLYFTIDFKSTNRFFNQPYYRRKIVIEK